MNFTNENKLQQLERKVEELERKLNEKASKDETIREVEARLAGYQDIVRTEDTVSLKKNFVIKNRKGKIPGAQYERDNSAAFFFNQDIPNRLNHIFMGNNSVDGEFNSSLFQATAVRKDEVANIVNNGSVQLAIIRQEDLTDDGNLVPGTSPQIQIIPTETVVSSLGGKTVLISAVGDGYTRVGHTGGGTGFIITSTGILQAGSIVPSSNNSFDIGSTTSKIKTIHAVNTNFGDIGFQNGWTITETEKVGVKEKGLAILDDKDNLVCVIGKDGIKTNVKYKKTTKEERAQMLEYYSEDLKKKDATKKDKLKTEDKNQRAKDFKFNPPLAK